MIVLLFISIWLQNPSPSRGKTSQPQQSQTNRSQQPASADQRGTEQAPIFVKQIPTPKTEEETTQETKDRNDKAANDRNLVKFTFWLVIATGFLGLMALVQAIVFGIQAVQLQRTVKAAGEQSDAMERSIAEGARAAKAMEDVATHFERSVAEAKASTAMFAERGQMQMRAYICIEVGTAFYQDRTANIKFAGRTNMVNAGNTPAHNVRFRAKAAILPVPLAEDFPFPLPVENVGGSLLGPHQRLTITEAVEDFVPDAEVEDIKKVSGAKALYIWGIISYSDVFHEEHITRFCQLLFWLGDGKTIMGNYSERHNDAT